MGELDSNTRCARRTKQTNVRITRTSTVIEEDSQQPNFNSNDEVKILIAKELI